MFLEALIFLDFLSVPQSIIDKLTLREGCLYMEYKVGDTVVYPRHGAARIEEITERTLRGVTRTYLRLTVLSSDGLEISVPTDAVDKVGVREVVNGVAVAKVFEILRTPIVEEKTNWSRRYKLNVEKIATGDVNKIAEVVRDLSQRDDDEHGLSAGEKRMLSKARNILTSEIALSEKIDDEEAQRLLDVNLGYQDPEPGDEKHHAQAPEEAAYQTLFRLEEEEKAEKAAAKKAAKEAKKASKDDKDSKDNKEDKEDPASESED